MLAAGLPLLSVTLPVMRAFASSVASIVIVDEPVMVISVAASSVGAFS